MTCLFITTFAHAVVELDGDSNGGVDIDKGGTNAVSASAARTALGVEIGFDVQAYNSGNATTSTKIDDFTAGDDNTDLNATTSYHGLLRKLDNTATNYMDGTGAWSVPAGSGGFDSTTIDDTTWSDGANASNTWTFNLSGTNFTMIANSGSMDFSLGIGAGAGGFAVDADGDTIAKSYTSPKVSGVAGLLAVYEANSTDTNYAGWMGPASISESFSHQFPNAQPANSIYSWAAPAGSGDPNGNKISACTIHEVLESGEADGSPISTVYKKEWSFDPDAVCDGSVDRLFIMTIGADMPNGMVIDGWSVSFQADPTTEADLDFKRADAFIGVANSAVMDVLDTTNGASSEDTAANINGGSAVLPDKVIYLEFGTAYTATGQQIIFEMWWHLEGS